MHRISSNANQMQCSLSPTRPQTTMAGLVLLPSRDLILSPRFSLLKIRGCWMKADALLLNVRFFLFDSGIFHLKVWSCWVDSSNFVQFKNLVVGKLHTPIESSTSF